MLQKKIICDRCKKTVIDSENYIDSELGYVEVNFIRFDDKCTKTMHFCEKCYDVAVKAWNESIIANELNN